MALTDGIGRARPRRGLEPDPRLTPGYRILPGRRRHARPAVVPTGGQAGRTVPTDGPVILAPVHRSFIDFGFEAFVTRRKLHYMAKDTLWKNRFLGWLLPTLGAFPVHRESADREALRTREEVLVAGEVLVLFPEGTRRRDRSSVSCPRGSRSWPPAPVPRSCPIGIGGSDVVMPKGRRIPKPLRIRLVVGEPLPPPARPSGRVSRSRSTRPPRSSGSGSRPSTTWPAANAPVATSAG